MHFNFADTHLYTWVEKATVRVRRPAQEHNTVSLARAQIHTARSGDERTNHESSEQINDKTEKYCAQCSR